MTLLSSKPWFDFLLNIKTAKEELGNPDIIWYRGEQDGSKYLFPSIMRYENGLSIEQSSFHKFRRFADKIFHTKESEWETLFDMQHYNIPTRLLDWTENFGIALFFAANSFRRKHKEGAAMYLLNPLELNKQSGINKIYKLPYDEAEFSYSGIYWNKKPFKATAPIAIEPIFKNDRISAQRGTFTVHNDIVYHDILYYKLNENMRKVTLPDEAISSAKEFLSLASIDEFSVFPDMAGISQFINKTSHLQNWSQETRI
ncbi:FRG domain-containing protein [Mucilaginibacter sp. dw_454]|uniref:FRG domain-containing protein n=1 Tax=Mucilaginibacter sp. dw_454 TaxID=2720079 RepID=UPI001BD495F4|nr:FRG domain-containing protein [Mucilaginibacter sp. dw_454]